jgi:L-iditol 2-dehydrogenase
MRIAFDIAGNKSNICFIGTPSTDVTFNSKQWENINRKEIKLTGSWMGYSAPFPGHEWSLTARYFANGRLKLEPGMIYKTYPLSEAAEAFALFKNPSQIHGKVLLINE